jgi:hypothetical protein
VDKEGERETVIATPCKACLLILWLIGWLVVVSVIVLLVFDTLIIIIMLQQTALL